MKLNASCCLGLLSALVSASTLAAPGEYWEITSKMEMPGMKYSMPAQTHKVCVPKGEERNPKSTQQDKESNCEMIDLKNSGNKTSWKMKCVRKGDTMFMDGESTHERDSYSGKMHMTGKSGGRDMEMTQTYSGKRIGGACDTMEVVNKVCDDIERGKSLLASADAVLGPKAPCAAKKDALCSNARNRLADQDISVVFGAYGEIERHDKGRKTSIADACGLNLEAVRASTCAKFKNESSILKAATYCPAEAKAYKEKNREASNKRNCEGRGYTSRSQIDNCLAAKGGDSGESPATSSSQTKSTTKKAATETVEPAPKKADSKAPSPTGNPSVDEALETAKKLKGLLRF